MNHRTLNSMQKATFVEWLTLVDEYWTNNGKACEACDFNDERRGCEFLYNSTVPAGRCPGVDIEQPSDE